MLIKYTVAAAILLILGYWLSERLYEGKGRKFAGSDLQKKILLWIPIYMVAVLFAIGGTIAQLIILGFALLNCYREVLKNKVRDPYFYIFLILIGGGLIASLRIVHHSQSIFIAAWSMSVLSDVTAFFAGNYFGKHFLPKKFNSKKSWEGVAGQLVGALIGYLILASTINIVPAYLVLTVGFGSAIGDLANSYFKRKAHVRDWGDGLPGHGGYLDRFSSLGFALLFTSLFM